MPATYREPLCQRQALPASGWCPAPPRRALPLLHCSYELMRPTTILARTSASALYPRVFAGCGEPPAGRWWFPTLSPRVFPWMLEPLSRWHPRCTCPFLPANHRPSPRTKDGSAQPQTIPFGNFRTAGFLGMVIGYSSSFRPPGLRATRVAPTAAALWPQGSCGVYVRAEPMSLPSWASNMLTVRIGQLTVGDFHPIRLAALSAAPSGRNTARATLGKGLAVPVFPRYVPV